MSILFRPIVSKQAWAMRLARDPSKGNLIILSSILVHCKPGFIIMAILHLKKLCCYMAHMGSPIVGFGLVRLRPELTKMFQRSRSLSSEQFIALIGCNSHGLQKQKCNSSLDFRKPNCLFRPSVVIPVLRPIRRAVGYILFGMKVSKATPWHPWRPCHRLRRPIRGPKSNGHRHH